jgi:hypothetical protein
VGGGLDPEAVGGIVIRITGFAPLPAAPATLNDVATVTGSFELVANSHFSPPCCGKFPLATTCAGSARPRCRCSPTPVLACRYGVSDRLSTGSPTRHRSPNLHLSFCLGRVWPGSPYCVGKTLAHCTVNVASISTAGGINASDWSEPLSEVLSNRYHYARWAVPPRQWFRSGFNYGCSLWDSIALTGF